MSSSLKKEPIVERVKGSSIEEGERQDMRSGNGKKEIELTLKGIDDGGDRGQVGLLA